MAHTAQRTHVSKTKGYGVIFWHNYKELEVVPWRAVSNNSIGTQACVKAKRLLNLYD